MRQHDSGNNRKQSVIIILLTLILCVISFMAGVFIFKLSNKQSGQTSVVSEEEAGGQFENNTVNNSSITKGFTKISVHLKNKKLSFHAHG